MGEKKAVFVRDKALRDLGKIEAWYGLRDDGLKAKAERKNKVQEKILKSQAQAEPLLSPGNALWHRPLFSSLWETQHCSDIPRDCRLAER